VPPEGVGVPTFFKEFSHFPSLISLFRSRRHGIARPRCLWFRRRWRRFPLPIAAISWLTEGSGSGATL
jgi:hypothetical protein